jgi:hypothetical protein
MQTYLLLLILVLLGEEELEEDFRDEGLLGFRERDLGGEELVEISVEEV